MATDLSRRSYLSFSIQGCVLFSLVYTLLFFCSRIMKADATKIKVIVPPKSSHYLLKAGGFLSWKTRSEDDMDQHGSMKVGSPTCSSDCWELISTGICWYPIKPFPGHHDLLLVGGTATGGHTGPCPEKSLHCQFAMGPKQSTELPPCDCLLCRKAHHCVHSPDSNSIPSPSP